MHFFRKGTSPLIRQALAFIAIGGLNTLMTLAVIFLLLWVGGGLVASNFVGYAIGLMISCLLNTKFTFKRRISSILLVKFLTAAGIAYVANLTTVVAAHFFWGNNYIVQMIGMPIYTAVFFIINKLWVMK